MFSVVCQLPWMQLWVGVGVATALTPGSWDLLASESLGGVQAMLLYPWGTHWMSRGSFYSLRDQDDAFNPSIGR